MTLVDRSTDLAWLVEEEYDIEVRDSNLLVHHVPYLNEMGEVARCILVSELTTNGEQTVQPGRHEVWVVGGIPHDHLGNKISIIVDEERRDYGDDLVACCRLSGKPNGQSPRDYHQLVSNYVRILSGFARAIDASASHKSAPPRQRSADESVFRYHDSATSRSGLSAVTKKLEIGKVAIVGLGGTGSYILDLVSKTPVGEIHLFDDDVVYAHNAFRAPGAATLDELRQSPHKVQYFASMYDAIRRNIFAHPIRITGETLPELAAMDFVFLAMDAGPDKYDIIKQLQAWDTPFIDSGMGIQRQENSLRGVLRVTTGTTGRYDHLDRRISFGNIGANEYDQNIQTADLNMMNAAMAVTKWKKLLGYYVDAKLEYNSVYTVARNAMTSGEVPA